MFKKITLAIALFIATTTLFSATLFEDFDGFTNSGYGNYTHNGWVITNGLSENQASRLYQGIGRTVRLRNNSGSSLASPAKTGGIGTIDFWYGNWDGSPAISKVYIETSSNGTSWTKVDSIVNVTSVPYLNYTKVLNDAFGQYVRIVNSGEERLFIDNVTITDATSGCTGYYTDSIVDTICSLDSVSFRGAFRKTAGIYRDTVNSTCDTIFILNLFTETYTTYDVFDTICSVNDSILFNGNYLKVAGVYYDTTARTGLCDSISKLTLTAKSCPLPCNDLFFSEYIEGGSSNKAIEIYNPTSSPISMSGYEVKLYANGSSSASNTLTLSGNIPAYGVYVISNSSSSLTGITTNSDITSGVASFNGNDALELKKNSIVIDVIGTIGSSSDFAKDVTLVRNATVQQGNLTYTPAEWTIMAKDVDTMIGFHQSICQPCTPDRDTTTISICEGDSATNGVSFYSVSGIFADTLTNNTGCDSIRVLDLTVNSVDRDTIADTICMGASITFGTQTLTMTGNYSDTVQNASGCDSITVMELLVNDILRDTIADTICMGASITFGTQTLTMTGNYSDTVQNASGCDSITVMELLVNDILRDTIADTICMGASITFGTKTLTMTGNYSDTVQNASGCDSITVMELLVNDNLRDTIADTICMGASITFGTQTLTMTGNYSDTVQNASGCDSITVMELLVNDILRDTIADTICMGASITFGTQTLTMTGNYSDTVQNASGCDSITVMELLVNDILRDTIADTICMGASITFGTQTLTMTGNYSDTVQNASGCDSITVMELLVNDILRDTIADTICMGASITFGTQTLTMTGNYSDTVQNASGCDSITVMELLVNDILRDTIADTICMGASITFGTQTLTMTGNYSDTVQNASGCDSITVMELLVNDILRDTIADTICMGASITFGTQTLTMTGNYSDTVQNASGCDSITVMELLVNDFLRDTIADTICENGSIVFGGNSYSIAGTYNDTVQTSAGCDSIVSLNLTVNVVSRDTIVDTICAGSSSLLGTIGYTTTGIYSDTLVSSLGCDSIRTLNLFVIRYNNPIINVQSCDSFLLPTKGYVYTSGVYRDTLVSSTGL